MNAHESDKSTLAIIKYWSGRIAPDVRDWYRWKATPAWPENRHQAHAASQAGVTFIMPNVTPKYAFSFSYRASMNTKWISSARWRTNEYWWLSSLSCPDEIRRMPRQPASIYLRPVFLSTKRSRRPPQPMPSPDTASWAIVPIPPQNRWYQWKSAIISEIIEATAYLQPRWKSASPAEAATFCQPIAT